MIPLILMILISFDTSESYSISCQAKGKDTSCVCHLDVVSLDQKKLEKYLSIQHCQPNFTRIDEINKLTFSNCRFKKIMAGTFKEIKLKKLVLSYSVFLNDTIQAGTFDFGTTDVTVVIYSRNDQKIFLPSRAFGSSVSKVHVSYGTLANFSTEVFQNVALKSSVHFLGVTILGQNKSSQIQRASLSLMIFNKTKIYAPYHHPVINVSVSTYMDFYDSVLDFVENSIIIEGTNNIKFSMEQCSCQELCRGDIGICQVIKNVSICKNDEEEYEPYYGKYVANNCQIISSQEIIGITIGCLFLLVLIMLVAILIARFFRHCRMERKLLDKFQVAYPATTIFKQPNKMSMYIVEQVQEDEFNEVPQEISHTPTLPMREGRPTSTWI